MATSPLTISRALRPPRRIDARALVGFLLMLVAFGSSITFWSASSDTQAILVATRNLPAGATLRDSDLAVARVRVDPAIYQAAIPASERATVVGKQLAEPVHAQQMLVFEQVSTRPRLNAGQVVTTIPVKPETALGGHIQPGNEVDVIAIVNKGKPEMQARVVLPRVTVYATGYDQRSAAINTTGSGDATTTGRGEIRWITVVVTAEQAVQLAQAKGAGELEVVLLAPQE